VDAEAAETYLRVLAETQLRHFRDPGFPDWDGVRELRYVGGACRPPPRQHPQHRLCHRPPRPQRPRQASRPALR
jgi:hypothetical protein